MPTPRRIIKFPPPDTNVCFLVACIESIQGGIQPNWDVVAASMNEDAKFAKACEQRYQKLIHAAHTALSITMTYPEARKPAPTTTSPKTTATPKKADQQPAADRETASAPAKKTIKLAIAPKKTPGKAPATPAKTPATLKRRMAALGITSGSRKKRKDENAILKAARIIVDLESDSDLEIEETPTKMRGARPPMDIDPSVLDVEARTATHGLIDPFALTSSMDNPNYSFASAGSPLGLGTGNAAPTGEQNLSFASASDFSSFVHVECSRQISPATITSSDHGETGKEVTKPCNGEVASREGEHGNGESAAVEKAENGVARKPVETRPAEVLLGGYASFG